jgi:large subunit ribosomal protein L25
METFDIHAYKRLDTSKPALKRLRGEGLVPGVLYSGADSIPITVTFDQIRGILDKHGSDVLLNVDLEGHPVIARIREVQREPVNQEIRHIDLMPLDQQNIEQYLH